MLNSMRLRSAYANGVLATHFDDPSFRPNVDVAEIGPDLEPDEEDIAQAQESAAMFVTEETLFPWSSPLERLAVDPDGLYDLYVFVCTCASIANIDSCRSTRAKKLGALVSGLAVRWPVVRNDERRASLVSKLTGGGSPRQAHIEALLI